MRGDFDMIIEGKTFVHHYSPKRRDERGEVVRTVVFRHGDDPYICCMKEVDVIYDKVRRLLTTVETWLDCSVDDEITEEMVQGLYIGINKTMAVVASDIEELITTHKVTDRRDLFELRDVVVQLQEIADDLFKPYINSSSTEILNQG